MGNKERLLWSNMSWDECCLCGWVVSLYGLGERDVTIWRNAESNVTTLMVPHLPSPWLSTSGEWLVAHSSQHRSMLFSRTQSNCRSGTLNYLGTQAINQWEADTVQSSQAHITNAAEALAEPCLTAERARLSESIERPCARKTSSFPLK